MLAQINQSKTCTFSPKVTIAITGLQEFPIIKHVCVTSTNQSSDIQVSGPRDCIDKCRNKSDYGSSDCQSRALVAVRRVADCEGTSQQRLKEQCSAWSLLLPSSLSASHQRLSLRSADLVSLMRSDKVSESS